MIVIITFHGVKGWDQYEKKRTHNLNCRGTKKGIP